MPIFGHIRHIRKFGFVSTNYSSHPYLCCREQRRPLVGSYPESPGMTWLHYRVSILMSPCIPTPVVTHCRAFLPPQCGEENVCLVTRGNGAKTPPPVSHFLCRSAVKRQLIFGARAIIVILIQSSVGTNRKWPNGPACCDQFDCFWWQLGSLANNEEVSAR